MKKHLAPLFAFYEEGYETKAGTIIESEGWYYAFMGQMIGPFETEAEAKADATTTEGIEALQMPKGDLE